MRGFQSDAMQAVEVSLMPQVFVGGKFYVDALGLEDDADLAADGGWITGASEPMIAARPAVGTISVERMRKSVVLPLPLGPSKPKSSAGRTSKETSSRAVRSS